MEKMTHWKRLTNPLYLGAYSLDPGQEPILTIKSVGREMVVGADGKKEECTVAHFMEPSKPMIINVTNAKTISKIYGTPYIEEWAGKQIQIYATAVKVAGEMVDALRIRPFPPKAAAPISCSQCGAALQKFGKMGPAELAKYTTEKYGHTLCADCARQAAEKQEVKNDTDQ